MPKPWLIYTRVSSDEQAREGLSMEAQRLTIEGLLKAQGVTSYEVIADDGRTGKNLRRPGMTEVLRRCERGDAAGVAVYAIDRLTRSRRDIVTIIDALERGGADLVSVREKIDTGGPMGRFVLHLLVNIANLEVDTISQRVSLSYDHVIKAGGHWGKAPAGTVLQRGADRIPRLAPHPEHGKHVGRVWRMLVDGSTLHEAADYLNRQGVPARGKGWTRTGVQYLVRSRHLVGVLVDAETWQAAQQALGARSVRARNLTEPVRGRGAEHHTALSGLCWCRRCGSAMVVVRAGGRSHPYEYLRCTGRAHRGREFCDHGDIPAGEAESAIVGRIREWLSSGSAAASLSDWVNARMQALSDEAARLPAMRAARDELQRRAGLVLEVVESGGMPPALAAQRLRAIQDELDAANARLTAVESAEAIMERHRAAALALPGHLSSALDELPGAGRPGRADALAGLIHRVDIDRDTGCDIRLVPLDSVSRISESKLPRLDTFKIGAVWKTVRSQRGVLLVPDGARHA